MISYIELAGVLRRSAGVAQAPFMQLRRRFSQCLEELLTGFKSGLRAAPPVAIAGRKEIEPAPSSPLPSDAVTACANVEPRRDSFLSLGPHGFHRIVYTDWGDPANSHVVMCMHGFTRNSRDFDMLARNLAQRCRVVCMDVAGRGESDWLERKEDYDFSLYLSDAAALLARVLT